MKSHPSGNAVSQDLAASSLYTDYWWINSSPRLIFASRK